MLVVGCAERHREFPSGPIDPWQPHSRDRVDSGSDPVDAATQPPPVAETDRCAPRLEEESGTEGRLTVSFSTVTLHGLYAPRNCGAVWIEDANQSYVRTLEAWAQKQQLSVVQWNVRACHAGPDASVPDVVASATLLEHKPHEAEWDGTDFRGALMPDGKYTLWMQVAENEIFPEGPFLQVPFHKGQARQLIELPAADGFEDIKLEYVPRSQVEHDE